MGRREFAGRTLSDWARLQPDDDLTPLHVGQYLIWVGRLTEEVLEAAAKSVGLRKRGDYEVLALMRRFEPDLLSPVDIATQLLTSPSGMTGKLDRLETQGLVKRDPDPIDRRAVKIVLTDEGRELVDAAFRNSLEAYQLMVEGIEPAELQSMTGLLGKVLDRLDQLVSA